MVKVIDKGDVVIVCLKNDIRVDVLESVDGCINLRKTSLVRLEEQPVHIG